MNCYCLKKHKLIDEDSYMNCFDCHDKGKNSCLSRISSLSFEEMESKDKHNQRLKKLNKL